MIYKLDNVPLSSFGAYPAKNNWFALDGMLNLPKRIGKTEYDWGTEIEPFVDIDDIEFDGRKLTLRVAIKKNNLDAFVSACIDCKVLSFDHDSFNVVCRDEVEVKEIVDYYIVTVRFWQNVFQLKPVTLLPSGSGDYRIDNYDLNKDFGIYISKTENLYNTAKRIEINTTELYTKTQYRSFREAYLKCSMLGTNFADLYNKMNQFQAVLMAPGLRTLKVKTDLYQIYYKNGIAIDFIFDKVLKFYMRVTILQKLNSL